MDKDVKYRTDYADDEQHHAYGHHRLGGTIPVFCKVAVPEPDPCRIVILAMDVSPPVCTEPQHIHDNGSQREPENRSTQPTHTDMVG